MAVNSLYPAFVKMFYSVSNRQHVQTISINYTYNAADVGGDPTLIQVVTPNGLIAFKTALDAWIGLLKPAFNTAAQFGNVELWAYPTINDDPRFITSFSANTAGTSGTATVPYSQSTWSFRSTNGGILKVVLLDTVFPVNVRDDAPITTVGATGVVSGITLPSYPFLARDGGRGFTPIRLLTKTNDVLRKRYMLDS